METMKIKLYALIFMTLFVSCSKEEDKELYFIGDSLIEKWDLQRCFPSYITHNNGVPGSGIKYIQSKAGAYKSCSVIVLTGTNDVSAFNNDLETYSDKIVTAIYELRASQVYIISIFPRLKNENNINESIKLLNELIKKKSTSAGMIYVDVYDDLSNDCCLKSEFTMDGVHINMQGYEIVTNKIKKVLR